MTPDDRTQVLVAQLLEYLDQAALLVARGRAAFDEDHAVSLALEAVCNRVGDVAKKLMEIDSIRFADAAWKDAAKNRDFIVHHYYRIERETLWFTVSESFPTLRAKIPTD